MLRPSSESCHVDLHTLLRPRGSGKLDKDFEVGVSLLYRICPNSIPFGQEISQSVSAEAKLVMYYAIITLADEDCEPAIILLKRAESQPPS